MQLRFDQGGLTVTKEPGDTRIREESTFYYRVVNALRELGYDVVRQVPSKDGHLTGAPYYIRQRKRKWALFHNEYAIESAHEEFNKRGWVRLVKYE